MELHERILSKEEINSRFITAVTAIMVNKLISSKTGLAESLGVKPAKFSEILNGRMNVGIDMIARMCDFYEVSPDWLLLSRGNNVFRRMAKQAIWIDDENLNMEYTESEMPDSKSSEETTMGTVPNVVSISPAEESVIYKMYKDKDEESRALIRENGRLEERLRSMEQELGALKSKYPHESPSGIVRESGEVLGSPRIVKHANTKPHSSTYEPSAGSVQPHPENQ